VSAHRPAGPKRAFAVIGDRRFAPYFTGNALSATGWWFQTLAAQLLVWRQTHSGLLLGVLTFAEFVPLLVLSPWSGALADRLDRKRILLVTQLISVVLSGGLALLTWAALAPPWVVILDACGLGIANAFASPAALALIPSLVDRENLGVAVGLNSMTWNLARAAGPALAALSVRHLGIAPSFALNAGSFLALVLGVLLVHPQPHTRTRSRAPLRDSVRLVTRNRGLLVFLATVGVVGASADPINTLGPAFAHAFGRPDTDAGIIIGVFGAGAVCAAFALSGRNVGSRRRTVATLALMASGIAAFSVLPSLPWALPLLFLAGVGYLASSTSATTQLQLSVAEHERGRAMALWNVAFLGLRPFASLTDGAIATGFGVRAAGVALQAPALCIALLLGAQLWRRRRPEVAAAEAG
jgi:MFS family permease